MKTILSIAILFLMVGLTSCKKDDPVLGCTDENALNYDSSADTDDGTCKILARFSFWQDFSNSQNLVAGNSNSTIRFYINGQQRGQMNNNVYSAVEPPCGNGGAVIQVSIRTSETASVQYEIRYYDGMNWLVFQNGILNMGSSDCISTEIIF